MLFRSEKVSDAVTRITGVSGEQMYLVEGAEKAALIDSGVGVGDLRAYVEKLTKLPVIVIVTHGHGDHALGAQLFDEAYMSHLDFGTYRARCKPGLRAGYLKGFTEPGSYEEKDMLPIPEPDYFRDLKDGDTFDVGGITLEAVACGGHSAGSMMVLLRELKILISGDSCNYFTMLQGDTCLGLSTYEANLRRAKERTDGKYDTICLCHGSVDVPDTLFDEVLEVIAEVKAGTDDKIPYGHLDSKGLVAKAFGPRDRSRYLRTDGKFGNIVYNPSRIWE